MINKPAHEDVWEQILWLEKERDSLDCLKKRGPFGVGPMEQALALLDDPFSIVDSGFKIVWANKALARIGQRTLEEIVGRRCHEVFHRRESVCDSCPVAEVFATGKSSVREQPVEQPDGTRVWVQKCAWPILNEEGEIAYAVEHVRDITDRKRAEELLRESEKKHRILIENLQEGIWAIDKDGHTTFVNQRMAEMLGYTVQEMQGRHLFTFMDQAGVEDCKRQVERRKEGLSDQHDFIFLRKDGTPVHTSLHMSPIRDDEGKYIGGLAAVSDITDRRQAEEALKASRERLALALDATSDGLFDWDMKTGRAYFSSGYFRMLGYAPDEFPASFEEWEARLHPDDRPLALKVIAEYREHRRDSHEIETRIATKTGDWRWVLSRGRVTERDQNGRPLRMVGTHVDINDRKRAEESLRESEENYEHVINSMQEILSVINADGTFLFCNRKAAANLSGGDTPADVIGKNIRQLVPAEQAEQLLDRYRLVSSTGRPLEQDVLVSMKSRDRWFHNSLQPIRYGRDGSAAILSLSLDITESKRDEEEVRRLKQQIEFILGAAKTGLDIVDPEFNMQYIDPEWQKIYGDPSGKKCYEYFMGRTEMCPGCGVPEALATKSVVITEQVLVREGNRPIQVTTLPFQNKEGKWFAAEVNVDISERKRMEEELRAKTVHLEESNTALRVLLKEWEEDKRVSEERIVSDLRSIVMPYTEKLRSSGLDAAQRTYVDLIESKIRDMAVPFSKTLLSQSQSLTPAESQIADLVREGKTNKEIANLLHLSEHTITFHRRNLRKKLGITSKKLSLRSHIQSLTEGREIPN